MAGVREACPPRLIVVADTMAQAWSWAAAHQVPMGRITFLPAQATPRHLPALRGLRALPYVELTHPGPLAAQALAVDEHWRWSGA